jgi:carboxyl-terminal processing protease
MLKKGYKNYYEDYQQRVFSGELLNKDSIKTIDSLQFKTPKGKIVYGGGGIIPDIFVALDTTSYLSNFYFNSINNFAFNFVDNNRTSLNKWTLSTFISDFDADETVLKSYLKTHKIEKKQGFKTRKRIQKYLKAAIANTLFGDEGFYRVLHQDDKMLQKVITLETSD